MSTMSFGRSMLRHWRLDPGVTYLNHGTVGAPPTRVLDAQRALQDEIERQPSRFLLRELTEMDVGLPGSGRSRLREAAREVAAWVHADERDLVLVPNATTGVNAVLRSLDLREGDELLITEVVYGGVGRAAAFAARQRGANVRVVTLPFPMSDPQEAALAVERGLGPRTRLAILDHVVSLTSWIMPVRQMAERCKARGVPVLVDGAHAPGAIALDVPSLGVDWYAASLHKWAFTPRPSGFLWASRERQGWLHPAVVSWGLDLGFVREFEWASTLDPSAFLAAPEGLRFLRELGFERVLAHNHGLAREAGRFLTELWGTSLGAPESMFGPMITVPLPERFGRTQEDAARLRDTLLVQDRIEVQLHAWRDRLWIRVSAQIYNERGDIERLAGAIQARA